MCDKALYDGFDDNDAVREAIKYLENNKAKLVKEALSQIINSKPSYIKRLNNNIQKFEYSITNGHIQWILEDLYNPDEVDFNKYNTSFVKDTPKAYCDIYKKLIELTNKIDEETKEILHDQFNAFADMYCPKN